jgi:hypothetical protein
VYVHFPSDSGEPPSVLRGFTRVELEPSQKQTVVVTLSRYDLSVWDAEKQGWRKPVGGIHVSVGASSRDLKLKGMVPTDEF